jgi:hypothetical protein
MLYSAALAALLALPGAQAQLNKLAKAAGLKYFGSATDNGELTDTSYVAILSNTDEFGQIVSNFYQFSIFGPLLSWHELVCYTWRKGLRAGVIFLLYYHVLFELT